ncbi:MAG: glycoside hydrolase family 26 protein [Candidatus Cryptobacteroides sp.]
MKYGSLIFPAAVLLSLFVSCNKVEGGNPSGEPVDTEQVELTLSDTDATAETKALYSNLWAIQKRGYMFGHHDDLMYGRYWTGETGRSDTKEVCGDYPGVYSLDFAEIMDDRCTDAAAVERNRLREKCIRMAYDMGMVVMACIHIDNPLTGGDAWDNSSDQVVKEILTDGSETRQKFNLWLDRLADFAKNLKGSDGKQIPVIFRPFHEHTQEWSWWGAKCTTRDEFAGLWKYTVEYLRDIKGVHNFIYAISPQMDGTRQEEDFYFRWPGDDYVDFIGMDCYHGLYAVNSFVNNLRTIGNISRKKKKPCGVTETGVEGFSSDRYWSTNIVAPMTGQNVAFVVMWRNKFVGGNESDRHFFSVYPGHPSEKDFISLYKRPDTFFCKDLPDMYKMAAGVTVK